MKRTKWISRVSATVALAGLSFTTGAALINSNAGAITTPRITSVVFTGSVNAPTITVHGQHLGSMPSTSPSYAPAGHGGCAVIAPTGNLSRFGYDYGSALYLHDSSTSPVWGAGRYRPGVGELDCVGVMVKKFTSSTVVFTLGMAYPNYPGVAAKYNLKAGNAYDIHVNGATFTGRIRYR